MPIPKTRLELTDLIATSFAKLEQELRTVGAEAAKRRCIDDWSIKDLLAVRLWWTERVIAWIETGRAGRPVTLPASGYTWNETPRLNADVIARSRSQSYESIRRRLRRGVERVLETIGTLDDRELLQPGTFAWAGAWPIARWISVNTARQYVTARTYVRRASQARGTTSPPRSGREVSHAKARPGPANDRGRRRGRS